MNFIDLEPSEEIPKKYITIIYEDKDTRVSWFADTEIDDVRFAIICACDSLVDGEFEALDDRAQTLDVNKTKQFENGQIIFLKKKGSGKPTSILLDGKRKLQIQIEPLRHIESQMAIKYILIGSNLLKHCTKGYPHIRHFQLSTDLKRILWYTKTKKINESQVCFDSIREITFGQRSEKFLKYPLKMLEELSFSIYYTNSANKIATLDLTCKDEREFDLWIIAIKALFTHFNKKIINKNDLICHSKSYNAQIKKGNVGNCSRFLLYDQLKTLSGSGNETNNLEKIDLDKEDNLKDESSYDRIKSLENFIVSRKLSNVEMAKLFLKLCVKLKAFKNDIAEINEKDDLDNNFSTGKQDGGYDMLANNEEVVDDLDTQKGQMLKLQQDVEQNLSLRLQQFLWYAKEHKLKNVSVFEDDYDEFQNTLCELENQLYLLPKDNSFNPIKLKLDNFFKEIDIQLWKIEIDLENVGDIITRIKTPQDEGFMSKIKGLFRF